MSFKEALSQEQANKRFALFEARNDNLHYDVFMKLAKGEAYSGRVRATFHLAEVGDMHIDTAAKSIEKLTINLKTVEPKRNDRFLSLPAEYLVKGENLLEIDFSNDYYNDGNGLHSYVDTDGKQYLYSTCEPYHCNKMLPCFDQPDLKATWSFRAAAPHDWIVVSNAREDKDTKVDPKEYLSEADLDQYKIWSFTKTLRFSTYLFCVVAGPYLEVKSSEKHRDVEMSCYCRESLYKFMKEQAEEIFEVTRVCMEFYEDFFGYKYPFGKYDQIFCPEYNMGAMENPGCVTFADSFIYKDVTTVQRRTYRSIVVTHELAHMWFGDLVTMKWWNDLWLNESFAEFISHFAMSHIQDKLKTIKFTDVWVEFLSGKGWGYREDQLETTHPINGDVHNTHDAESIFDGITYAKGSAVLKQLIALIGEKNFSNAMKTYFNKYEFGNTILQNFMDCMQENYKPLSPAYPASLDEWQKQWIQTAGLNELTPCWEPTDSNKVTITLKQTPVLPQHPTLRVHKMKIAFYGDGAELLEARDFVVPASESVTLTFEGPKRLRGILLNHDDEAFIKIRIDPQSTEFLKNNLKNIKGELSRTLIWRAFWDMLRDGMISSLDFIDIVSGTIEEEESEIIISDILSYASAAVLRFTPIKLRSLLAYKVFDLVYHLLLKTDPNDTNKVVSLRSYLISFARNPNHVDLVIEWFKGNVPALAKYPLGLDDKWSVVELAHEYKHVDLAFKKECYAKVQQEDNSDDAVKVGKTAEALLLGTAQRGEAWQSYLKQGKDSVHVTSASMSGFNSVHRLDELSHYHNEFFKVMLDVLRNESKEYASAFYGRLYPNGDDLECYIKKTAELIGAVDEKKEAWFLKKLRQSVDDLKRKQKTYVAVDKYLKNQC